MVPTIYAPTPLLMTAKSGVEDTTTEVPPPVVVPVSVVVSVAVSSVPVVVSVSVVVSVTAVSTGASAAGFTDAVVSVCFVSRVSVATVAVGAATNLIGLSAKTVTVPAEIVTQVRLPLPQSLLASDFTRSRACDECGYFLNLSKAYLYADVASTLVIPVRSALVASKVPSVTLRVVKPDVLLSDKRDCIACIDKIKLKNTRSEASA